MNSPIRRRDLLPLSVILGFQMFLVLPFLDQPFHMDDGIYLDIGKNVLKKPLAPQDFPYCFEGYCAPDMASHSHPPFIGYWLGTLLWIQGDQILDETTMHRGFLVFPLLLALSGYLLARRFTKEPIVPTLMILASPVAVVMSHNLMSDYPSLAFWTTGVALFIWGVDRRQNGWIWLASLFLTLAAFTSYPALLAAVICWYYAFNKRCRLPTAWLAPALPFAWMSLWLLYSTFYFGRFILGGTAGYFIQEKATWSAAHLFDKWLSFPILLAATVSLPLGLLREAVGWLRGRVALLWILLVLAVTQVWVFQYEISDKLLFITLLSVGGLIIFPMASASKRSMQGGNHIRLDSIGDTRFLVGWLGAVTLVVFFLYSSASARYLLPLIPPYLLLADRIQDCLGSQRRRIHSYLSVMLALLLALAFSTADFQMARVHREMAEAAGRLFQGWESRVRFGGEWGFRYYSIRKGFRQFLTTSDDLSGGDFVLLPQEAIPYQLPQDIASMSIPIGRHSWSSGIPIRLMNRSTHAGFYSSGWGLLPFSISDKAIETLTVLQVSQLADRLPEIRLEGPGGQIALTLPAPEEGIDLQVPLPSRLLIPYDGPSPAWVNFSLVIEEINHDLKMSPRRPSSHPDIRVTFAAAGSPIPLQSVGDIPSHDPFSRPISRYRFEIPASNGGRILLELDQGDLPLTVEKVRIRNWSILPPGWKL